MCVDWNNLLSTFIGAFAGALGAYFCNIKQAKDELKSNEKAKLLKLFYDINILTKTFVYHYCNTAAQINNLTKADVMSCTPITIKDNNLDIDEYGFLTKLSPKLYEMLTYVYHDIDYICEQENIATELLCQEVEAEVYLVKLEHIKVSTLKLLAKLYVNLKNINCALVKYYGCKNLIKEEIINSHIRAKKVINRELKEFEKILSDTESKKKMDKEDLKTIQIDSEYIKEIMLTWYIDFSLCENQKEALKNIIERLEKEKWEAPENDL